MPFSFVHSYASISPHLSAPVNPTPVASPSLLAVNDSLADILHLTRNEISSPEGVSVFAGNTVPAGSQPIALAYAGHQFGNLVPQLGDGRAILLGEVIGRDGQRYDVQLKGAGRTLYSRGGDGRAAIGPVLREFLVSEAMHALGVPTTRALCAVATGEPVYRETPLPGAILTRVARSHLRVGTFEYLALREDYEGLQKLTDYALNRLYPATAREVPPALELLDAVISAQAELVAHWMSLGFVHGVMNTDNMAISGETIDYGPCAFLDTYDPGRTFSSIDRRGRYAFANQPPCALWNLTRLAEALLPLLIQGPTDEAKAIALVTAQLESFSSRFETHYHARLRCKLGLQTARPGDGELTQDLLRKMADARVDYTLCFRRLSEVAAGGDPTLVTHLFTEAHTMDAWLMQWRQRLASETQDPAVPGAIMKGANPRFIPRNHRIEEVIDAATQGNLAPLHRLHHALLLPYEDQPAYADLATPPGEEQWLYRTFCGT